MVTIQQLIEEFVEDQKSSLEIAAFLGVSVSMVSAYKGHSYNPSLEVAKTVYAKSGIQLHPFAEESLIHEIDKDNR